LDGGKSISEGGLKKENFSVLETPVQKRAGWWHYSDILGGKKQIGKWGRRGWIGGKQKRRSIGGGIRGPNSQ
jgi:hypothetical protein